MSEVKDINCKNCGAKLIYNVGSQKMNCEYCGSEFVIDEPQSEPVKSTNSIKNESFILPFKVTKDKFISELESWLTFENYSPIDILDRIEYNSIEGVFLPAFIFEGVYEGSWTASSGYERNELIPVMIRRSYFTNSYANRQRIISESRTVTDWSPIASNCKGPFRVYSLAADDKDLTKEMIEYINNFNIQVENLHDFNADYAAGFELKDFTLDEKKSWDSHGMGQANDLILGDISKSVPGQRVRDFSPNIQFEVESSKKMYLPLWKVHYTYAGKEYIAIMEGAKVSEIKGAKPLDTGIAKRFENIFIKAHISAGIVAISFLVDIFTVNVLPRVFTYIFTFIFLAALATTIPLYIMSSIKKKNYYSNLEKKRVAKLNSRSKH